MSVKIKISVPLNIWKICYIEYSWFGKSVFIPPNQSSILTAAATSGSRVGQGWGPRQGRAMSSVSHVGLHTNMVNLLWEFRWVYVVKENLVCFCFPFGKFEPQWSSLSQGRTLSAHIIGHQGQSVLTSNPCDNRNGSANSLRVAGDVGTLVDQPFKKYFLSAHHM